MRKLLLLLLFIFVKGFSQGVLPPHRYAVQQQPLLNASPANSTFAYSLRKLKSSYNGYAIRVTNKNDYSTADVLFDKNNLVSDQSDVVIVNGGNTTFSTGQTMPLSTFKNIGDLSVEIWYNQNISGYNAVQNAIDNQPVLDLTGGSDSLPTLLFSGYGTYDSKYLVVQAGINEICPGGLGSFLMVTKPTANIDQVSFGAVDAYDWRWSFHLNWGDGNLYFDAAEYCCAYNRNVYNAQNIDLWKQYSFVRDNFTKSIRTNTEERVSNALSQQATPSPFNSFGFGIGTYIQNGYAADTYGYQGAVSEIIMFDRALSSQELLALEYNQMKYWKIY